VRIQEITNWAYGLTLVFTGLSAAAFIASSYSADRERVAVEEHLALDEMADMLALDADKLTEDTRLYVMTGNAGWLADFQADEAEERRLEKTIANARAYEPSQQEMEILTAIESQAEALDALERRAIDSYGAGDVESARAVVFGPEHVQVHASLMANVTAFRNATAARTSASVHDAKFRADFFGLIARILLALTGALFLGVLYFVLRQRVAKPLVEMAGVVRRLARQDYDIDLRADARHDEIGEMANALAVFKENGLERQRLDTERRKEQRTKDLILQMMHRVQACQARSELAEMITLFLPQIFPGLSGSLFVLNERHSTLRLEASWGSPLRCAAEFEVSECWALRRGHPHLITAERHDVQCAHIAAGDSTTLCVPLSALGEMIGLLYFEESDRELMQSFGEVSRLYLELIAENVGLALANLDLREKLLDFANRDPLSGVLNRRSLNLALERFSDAKPSSLTCMMLDIDFFKKFNDQFGHDAGDMVIQHVAQILNETVGSRGQLFRFGGEEFTALLPDITPDDAASLADELREAVARYPLSHHGQLLGQVTLSVGVARMGPGGPHASLMNRADAALLRAKANGRNRVEIDPAL